MFWMGLGAFVLGGSFVCRRRSVGYLVNDVFGLIREGKEGDGKKEGKREGIRWDLKPQQYSEHQSACGILGSNNLYS